MAANFKFVNNFVIENKSRIDLFWSTIFANSGKESLYLGIYFFFPAEVFLGLIIITERLKNHAPLYFWGMEKFSIALPNSLSMLLNLALWILYFLILVTVTIYYYKPLNQKMEENKLMNTTLLSNNFSPAETVAFSSLRISDELNKYAKAKVPSDFGFGGDLDWIEGTCYSVLTGKWATGAYRSPNISSNSFFVGLTNENDIIERLRLNDWYPITEVQRSNIFGKLFKLRDFIYKVGFWKDYSMGAQTYRSLAQTFIFANLHNKEEFLRNLNYTLQLFEEYNTSIAPPKGIPYYTIKITPKVFKIIIIILLGIIFVVANSFLPKWVVIFVQGRFDLGLNPEAISNILALLLVPLTSFIWKR